MNGFSYTSMDPGSADVQLHINVILAAIKFSYAGANIANIRSIAILANTQY